RRRAGELGDGPGHDLEQRALAGAVQPHDADLGAWEERQPYALQDLPVGRVDLAEILHDVDVLIGHGSGSSWYGISAAGYLLPDRELYSSRRDGPESHRQIRLNAFVTLPG